MVAHVDLVDRFGRVVRDLRISVTDRCNFRCTYCMDEEMTWLPRSEVLTFEEIGTHETYQIKGRYLSHRPVSRAEIEVADLMRERFTKSVRSLYDEQTTVLLAASIPALTLAIEIGVNEVFVQTPGPGAGARIAP